ncbi:MAG: hypothetical protein AABX70_07145 [Nanoarchaeota archaeon]
MNTDIVVPNGNEEAFTQMAQKLGYTSLIYAYEKNPKEIKVNLPHQIALFSAKPGKYLLIGQSCMDLEKGKIDFLTNLELEAAQDKHHHRQSGLNQVYSVMAKKQKTVYCVNLHLLITSKEPEKILGRMMQNVRLCRKYGIEIQIFSFATNPYEMRSPKDMQAFGRVLGIRKTI